MQDDEIVVKLSIDTSGFKDGIDRANGEIFVLEQRQNCKQFNYYLARMEYSNLKYRL